MSNASSTRPACAPSPSPSPSPAPAPAYRHPCLVPAPVPAPAVVSPHSARSRRHVPASRPHLTRDKRRSRSVNDLFAEHPDAFAPSRPLDHSRNHTLDGLGLSFEHAHVPVSDYFALGPPAPIHVHIAARTIESAVAQLASAERPVTHLLLHSIHNPTALTELLNTCLPSLASSLLVLKMSDCRLSLLPAEIKLCNKLEELDISYNPLGMSLPSDVSHLSSLRVLLMDHIGVVALPDWLCHLERLAVVSAQHNCLSHLPSSLHKLVRLERLKLDDNPWSPTWGPLVAAIIRGPPAEAEPHPPLESQSTVTLASALDDDEEDLASEPAETPTKAPTGILSALRASSLGDVKAGIKASRSSVTLHGGSMRMPGQHSSGPTTPSSSGSRSRDGGRHSFGSSDARSERSKWSFSLRRGRGLKLEPPPLPFPFSRSLSGASRPLRPPEPDTSPSPSTSTTGPSSTTTGPLTPLDIRRFSGINFWESLSSGKPSPLSTRANIGSPSAFRPGLAEHPSLAAPLSYLSLEPPASVDTGRCDAAMPSSSEWTHRQAAEHRIDIKQLLASLRDMHDLEEAQEAYQTSAATPFAASARPLLVHASPTTSEPTLRSPEAVGELKRVDDPTLRRRIIQEIIESEESYVRGMQEFLDVYVTAAQQFDPVTSAPVVPLVEQRIVFGNLPALVTLHSHSVLPALQAAATAPSDSGVLDQVSEVFLAHSAFFRMYTAYINNRDLAQHLLALWVGATIPPGVESRLAAQLNAAPGPCVLPAVSHSASASDGSELSLDEAQCNSRVSKTLPSHPSSRPGACVIPRTTARPNALSKSTRKARQKYLRKCAADPRRSHMSIHSYLMLPVQRVPRYRLLLEALVKATPPPEHPTERSWSHGQSVHRAVSPATHHGKLVPATQGVPVSMHEPDQGSALSPLHTPATARIAKGTSTNAEDSADQDAALAIWRNTNLPPVSWGHEYDLKCSDVTTFASSPCGELAQSSLATGTGSPSSSLSGPEAPSPGVDRAPARRVSHRLDEALMQIRDLAHMINESKRRAEQDRRLFEWQAHIAGTFPSPLVQPHRRLVRDGVVTLRKIVRLSSERVHMNGAGGPDLEQIVPTLQQTVVEEPVVLLLCNDLVVFLTAPPDSLPLLRAAAQDAAAHAALTEAVAASACASPDTSIDLRWDRDRDGERLGQGNRSGARSATRPPPPDSAGPLLQADPALALEVFAILRRWPSFNSPTTAHCSSSSTTGTKVERVDATTIRIMDHTKLLHLSAQSPGDADSWIAVLSW